MEEQLERSCYSALANVSIFQAGRRRKEGRTKVLAKESGAFKGLPRRPPHQQFPPAHGKSELRHMALTSCKGCWEIIFPGGDVATVDELRVLLMKESWWWVFPVQGAHGRGYHRRPVRGDGSLDRDGGVGGGQCRGPHSNTWHWCHRPWWWQRSCL